MRSTVQKRGLGTTRYQHHAPTIPASRFTTSSETPTTRWTEAIAGTYSRTPPGHLLLAALSTMRSSVSALSNTLLQSAPWRCYNPGRCAHRLRPRPRLPRHRTDRRRRLRQRATTARSAPRCLLAAGPVDPLRVRPALRGLQELPLRDQLLPDRDALHPVRHRGDLPLPDRRAAARVRDVRTGRDGGLHHAADGRVRLRVAAGGT